jgi:AAA domain
MFNSCPECGEYSVEKSIVRPGVAVCPSCKQEIEFRQLPLFVVTGASASGKSTLALELVPRLDSVVGIETDILWEQRYWSLETGFREFNEIWLRVAKNIAQAGRPVLAFRPCIPPQLEQCSERRYFADIHYLALVCDDEVLAARLRERPEWRNTHSREYIDEMLKFNHWLKAHVSDELTLLDTGSNDLDESIRLAGAWVDERLPHP